MYYLINYLYLILNKFMGTLHLDFPELYTFLDIYNEIENIIKKKIPQKEKETTKIIANFSF